MAHIHVKRGELDWREMRGTALKVTGPGLYRVIITEAVELFANASIQSIQVRMNGLDLVDLVWVTPPDATIARGYVSIEGRLV